MPYTVRKTPIKRETSKKEPEKPKENKKEEKKEEKPKPEPAKATSSSSKSMYDTYWGSNKVIPVVVLALLIDLIVLAMSGDAVRSKIWENLSWALGLHVVFAIAMTAMDPNPKTKSRLAMALAGLCILAFLNNVLGYDTKSAALNAKNKAGGLVPSMPKRSGSTAIRPVSDEERSKNHGIAYRFFTKKFGFDDARLLVYIAFHESRFVHTNSDGTVLRHHNGGNKGDDIGLMGINEVAWGARAKELGLDLNDLDDNLEMARVIFEEKGCEEWSTCSKARRSLANESVEVVEAPIQSWSRPVKVRLNCVGTTDRKVRVKTDLDTAGFDMYPLPAVPPNVDGNYFFYNTMEGDEKAKIEYHCW